ncbi:hypothetical protein ILUMI_07627 [Ignelater luminosus]|uniref:Caspase-1 n=1 Tax=Ignelater luminosus TaxID=2038154 RepID=A0A8K0D748_IGNLU|nr:hypothetical protein ILUMI_07627 [Ignelater luminosus]
MDAGDGNCIRNGNKNDEQDALGNPRGIYQNVIADMPTERNATHYNMNHKNRGLALVFNHEIFDIHELRRRSGTSVDCENLVARLEKLGFDVKVFHNLEYPDIHAHIINAANSNHSDSDCILVAVLTHGEHGILYAKDSAYKPEILWTPFTADKCPTLAGKPKLFFIQACQGDKLDPGVTLASRTQTDGHPTNTYRIPSQADFLIAYSTIPGFYSWRNTTRGSWFIQALCAELSENGYVHDLLAILTFVSRRVAIDYESNVPDDPRMHMQKQIPCITSMLTRLLKFNKKGDENISNEVTAMEITKEKAKHGFGGLFNSRARNQAYQVNY